MKKTKKWLALILAITLLGSNAVYSLSTSMKANEAEPVATSEEAATAPEEVPAPEQALEEPVVVETPAPEVTEPEVTQPAAPQEPEATVPEEVQPETPAETPPAEEAAPEQPVEKKHAVTINRPASEGGLIKVWTTGEKKDVSYNAENKFVEEVTEGTTFNFEISANEGYEVEKVTDQNGNEVAPKSVTGNVSAYEILNVSEEKVISILYKESGETKEDTEDPKAEEEQKEEQKSEKDGDAQTSTRAATETVEVIAGRNSDVVSAQTNRSNQNTYWYSSDSTIASLSLGNPIRSDSSGTAYNVIEGKKEGTATITVKDKDQDILKTIKVTVVKDSITVKFNPNGGSGAVYSYPVTMDEKGKYTMSLPNPEDFGISREGYIFAGWSDNSTGKGNNFVAGIEHTFGGATTMYAIWINESQSSTDTAYFYIRKDGEIQYEPAGYGGEYYYPTGSGTQLKGKIKTPVAVNNNLLAVRANILQEPSVSEIKTILWNQGKIDFDPQTQEIVWYVIKSRGTANQWNVDGVIRDKDKFQLVYNPNGGNTNVPGANEYAAGQKITVRFDKIPSRAGYTFLGWDENRNAQTPTYKTNGQTLTMPSSNVTLYAIWQANNGTEFTVEHYIGEGDDYTAYELRDTTTSKATTGGTITSAAYSIRIPGYGFVKAEPPTATVNGDGSTVVKLYYKLKTNLSYTVNYYEKGTVTKLRDSYSEGKKTFGESVTAIAPEIPGYIVEGENSATITIAESGNVINFYYVKRADLSYTVRYVDTDGNELLSPVTTGGQTYLAEAAATAEVIPGYTVVGPNSQTIIIRDDPKNPNEIIFVYAKRNDLSYVVNYLEQGTNAVLDDPEGDSNRTLGEKIEAAAKDIPGYNKVEPITASIVINADNAQNVINFYYTKRTDLSYTVNYLEQGTNKVLADQKIVPDKTLGETWSETAKPITGYSVVGAGSQEIVIQPSNNVINFYYIARTDLTATIEYRVEDEEQTLLHAENKAGITIGSILTAEERTFDGYTCKPNQTFTKTVEEEHTTMTIWYVPRADLSYKVNYLEQGTGKVLEKAKEEGSQTFGDTFQETAPSIDGYNVVGTGTQEVEITTGANEYTFYYTKRTDLSYTVKYLEDGTETELKSAKTEGGQTFGAKFDETAPSIGGYNVVGAGTQAVEITAGTNEYIFYYTKKADLSYTVKYLDTETKEAVADEKVVEDQTFGETVEENAMEVDGYNLADDAKKSITVQDGTNEIIFYYTKKNDLSYVVNYLEQGTDKVVAPAKPAADQTFGTEVTEKAVDVTGYNKVEPLEQTIKIASDSSKNVINFYYTKKTDLSYKVNYLEQGTGNVLKEAKEEGSQTFGDTFQETAPSIDGYNVVEPGSLEVEITTGANEYTFYYTKRTDLSYTVKYLEEGTDKQLEEPKVTGGQTFGAKFDETAPSIGGYNVVGSGTQAVEITTGANEYIFYYTKKADLSYTVKYLDTETKEAVADEKVVEDQTFGETIEENAIKVDGYNLADDAKKSITVQDGTNEIIFYYTKKNDLSYVVNYLEQGTDKVVAPAKPAADQTFGTEVTEKAVDVTGYNKVGPLEKTIKIASDSSKNVINFYYTKKTDLSYKVNYLEQGTGKVLEKAKEEGSQTFGDTFQETAPFIDGYNVVGTGTQEVEITTGANEYTFYYTKRTDLSYTVKYLEYGTEKEVAVAKVSDKQTYLAKVTDKAIDIEGYEPIPPLSKEITISANSKENVMTFYYTKRADLSYTVNYLEAGENGEPDKVLADAKTVRDKTYLSEVTEDAIDITGYNKPTPSSQKIVIDVADNVINFYYTKRADLSYTVNYLEAGENGEPDKVLADAKTVGDQTYLSEVTEEAIDITGYNKPAPSSQKIVIDVADNVINFYYTKKSDLSYTVKYLDTATKEAVAGAKDVKDKTFGETVEEDAIEIDGYNLADQAKKSITIQDGTNEIIFYYTKKNDLSYVVNYLEQGTDKVVAPAKPMSNQTFGDEVTEEAINVSGYIKEAPITATIKIASDSSKNVINFYYTKRADLSYTVNYLEEGTEEVLADAKTVDNQTYLSEVTEEAIDITGYNKPTPSSQKIAIDVADNVINFYYAKRADLSYTVNYLEAGENGEPDKVLADAKTVGDQTYLSEVTEDAIDITGYNKPTPSSQTIEIDVADNVINFYYTKRADLSYTVNYLEAGENGEPDKVLADAKTVGDQTYLSEVTEEAIDITGYNKPTPSSQTIEIDVADNVINFYYTKRADLSYTVNYLEAGENGEPDKVLADAKTVGDQTYLSEVTENAIDITGYNKPTPSSQTIGIDVADNVINFYYTKKSDLSYTVKYLSAEDQTPVADEKTVGGQIYLSEVTEDAIDITGYTLVGAKEQTFTVKDETNEIVFYYAKRNDLAYVVNYLEEGTNQVLKEAKAQANQTFEDEVTEDAPEIDGYRNVGPESKSIVISTDNEANVINFYYAKRADLSYQVRYYLDGEEAADLGYTAEEQTFESVISKVEDKMPAGYMLERTENLPLTIGTGENVIHVYYAEDRIGEGPNPDQPDNIPDRYQVVVNYVAVNGTVDFDRTVVTLRDEEGNPSETGTGTLQYVAAATANTGYAQNSLAWTDETPAIGMTITEERTFTATFAAVPATPETPTTPTTPTVPTTPTAPVAPATPTAPIVAAPIAVPAPVAAVAQLLGGPAGETIERLVEVQEAIQSEDGEVPLANNKLEHKCCILHFLIMLLALIVLALYTRSRKKHQQKIFELREQLEEETVKRQMNDSQEQEM